MNRTRQAFAPVALAALVVLSLGAPATARHRRLSLEERIKGAQFILVATVTKVEDGRKGAHGKVASLAVEALLRGDRRALGETPELIFATGYACDGQTFKAGDKAIFFLTRRKDGFCYRVNWQGGAVLIKGDVVKEAGKLDHKEAKPLPVKNAITMLRKTIKEVAQRATGKTAKEAKKTAPKTAAGAGESTPDGSKTAAKPATPSCPTCGKSDRIVKVYYGYASVAEAARHGGKSGGCCLDKNSPSHWCERCDAGVGRELAAD